MINFKFTIFEGLIDCKRILLPRFDTLLNINRYRVYSIVNNIKTELTSGGDTFDVNIPINTPITIFVTDLTGQYSNYTQTFTTYNRDIWVDISLLRNKQKVGIPNYDCHLGINGEVSIIDNTFNNTGDFLGGSNYFEWEIGSSDNSILYTNNILGVVGVERPRDVNGLLIPFNLVNSILPEWQVNANLFLTQGSVENVIYTQETLNEYNSYFTPILDVNGRIITYRLDLNNVASYYLAYMLQSGVFSSGCCGNNTYTFSDCEYPFELVNTQEVSLDYCHSYFNIIDIPCSNNKMLYSSSNKPLTFSYYCDGQWKVIGAGTSIEFDASRVCDKEEIRIKGECIYTADVNCCGNQTSYNTNSNCSQEITIKNTGYCSTAEIIPSQIICQGTLGCDDCGTISFSRFITQQLTHFKLNYDLNNRLFYHYHNQVSLIDRSNITETLIDNNLRLNTELSPCLNNIIYSIKKVNREVKTESIIFVSGTLVVGTDITDIDYTFLESGIYKIEVTIFNCCKIETITKEIFVYAKKYIEQLECSKYRLFHCLDNESDELVIKNYLTGKIYYDNREFLKGNSNSPVIDGIKIKYNEDLYTYDFELLSDEIYTLEVTDINGELTQFIIIHHCFITNCHQEYVKALLCEENVCKELLDNCMVTDMTLLKTYQIQKYVLLYDIFKTMLSKIVNLEYKHLIEPVVTLEDMSCINLYEMLDIMNKLKSMCVECGYKTNEEMYDCGCN